MGDAIMKKAKTLEVKLRSALRLIWSRSAERRAILKAAQFAAGKTTRYYAFKCPVCQVEYPIQMAEVDHIEPIGVLELTKITEWVDKLFHSPQRAICKLCHRIKTTQDRKAMKLHRGDK